MKKLTIIFCALTIAFACSTTKDLYSGSYDYVVSGTPDGDYKGTMTLVQTKAGATGTMSVLGQSGELENLYMVGDSLAFSGEANGIQSKVTAKYSNGAYRGTVAAMGFKFPFIATKKK